MAARGDVLALRRGIGFLPGERLEAFVVVQSDRLSHSLETVIVVPLDRSVPEYAGIPGVVPLAPTEAGEWKTKVAVVPHLTSLPLERFAPERIGRLRPGTLVRMGRVIRLAMDLE